VSYFSAIIPYLFSVGKTIKRTFGVTELVFLSLRARRAIHFFVAGTGGGGGGATYSRQTKTMRVSQSAVFIRSQAPPSTFSLPRRRWRGGQSRPPPLQALDMPATLVTLVAPISDLEGLVLREANRGR
jgi:hypothetical protein